MKTLLLSSFVIFHLIVLGQRPEKGVTIMCDSPNTNGYRVYYNADSLKIEEGTYIDDRKNGTWIKYYSDGITPKLIGTYENNRPKGKYSKYYDNGQLKEIGYFTKNQYRDSLIRYHCNGNREYAAFYDSLGKENGVVQYFYSNGQLEFSYNATNGNPTGAAMRYFANGDQKESIEYSFNGEIIKSFSFEIIHPPVEIIKEIPPQLDGSPRTNGVKWQPDGYNKVYNEDNEIWLDGVFKNGQLLYGKVYVYDRNGILLKVKVFKNGAYH